MYRYLTSCRDRLQTQLLHSEPLARSTELLHVLTHFDEDEKQYLRRIFLVCAWNRGSTQVISLLQRANILTMSEYIYNQIDITPNGGASFMIECDTEEMQRQCDESVQLIMNDLLETEYVLLADLAGNIKLSHAVGLKLTETLKECFRRVILDVYTNPTLAQRNYLHELGAYLSVEQMEQVRMLHWSVFEELEECSVLEAISNQEAWNEEFAKQTSSSLTAIMLNVSFDIHKCLPVGVGGCIFGD